MCEQVGERTLASIEGVAIGRHGGDLLGCHRTAGLVERDEYACLLVALAGSRHPVRQRSVRHGEALVGLRVGQSDDPFENLRIAVRGIQRPAREDVGAPEKGGARRTALHEQLRSARGVPQQDERRRRTERDRVLA
jgi:hypothetical protein